MPVSPTTVLPVHTPGKVAVTQTTNRIANRVNELTRILPDIPPEPRPSLAVKQYFDARISGHTRDGSNFRWVYTFFEVEKTSAGFGGWTEKEGGRSGDCYNRIEDMNGASGLFGNGVNSANLVGGFEIQFIPTNCVVRVDVIKTTEGETEYWCQYENGVDGPCP